jgi:type II pantothenate kinase
VLLDLLSELDGLEGAARWLALVEGALAANIFDWGAVACVELYKAGTILDIYRQARLGICRAGRAGAGGQRRSRMRAHVDM